MADGATLDFFIRLLLQLAVFSFIPAAAFTAALLRGVKLSFFDKAVIALIAGLVLAPTMAIIEFVFLGLKLSPMLMVANSLLVLFAGIIGLYLQGFEFSLENMLPKLPKISPKSFSAKENIARLLLLLIVLLAFYVRFEPAWSTSFQEIDPIYYDHVTALLVQNGAVPVSSFEVYYPLEKTYRVYPAAIYMAASWVHADTLLTGAGFDKYRVMLTAQFYPPLVAALMCFLAFLLIREEYGDFIGVIAAGVYAFTPQLVTKFGAGVNELQPFGLFSALLLFTMYWLANKRKSFRLGALAALFTVTAILGSAQAIWPLLVIGLFLFLHSFIVFWRGELDNRTALIDLGIIAGSIVGYFILGAYTTRGFSFTAQLLILIAAAVPTIFFTLVNKFFGKEGKLERHDRKKVLAAIVVLFAAITAAAPGLVARVSTYINATAGFAEASSALGKTVAEEGATNPGIFRGAFGSLDPFLLLPAITLLIVAASIHSIYQGGHKKSAGLVALLAVLAIVFNNALDAVLLWFVNSFFSQLQLLAKFIASSDVFIYLVIAIIALLADYGLSRHKLSYAPLYFALIILPVSYIGLNKVKYILHLAIALALALPVILGILLELSRRFTESLEKESDRTLFSKAALGVLFLAGLYIIFSQGATVGDPQGAMAQLRYSRINGDWLATYDWMSTTPGFTDEACLREYGFKCRVLSWWDYGHWTTFFGETQSVLDPGNEQPQFNHETARSFVDGNPENLRFTATYHQATHILVDNELIPKWGALVFLSGTCTNDISPICPETSEIDWKNGAGSSTYEAEHYYEFLTVVGQCPKTAVPVDMPALRSSLTGATYCLANDRLLLLQDQNTLAAGYERRFVLFGRDAYDKTDLNENTSFLVPAGNNQFININPDLSYAIGQNGALDNRVFYSAYARLFFFEYLEGTTLEYVSPNGLIKVYRIDPSFYLSPSELAQTLAGNPLPAPTPLPVTTPTPETNSSVNAANATTNSST